LNIDRREKEIHICYDGTRTNLNKRGSIAFSDSVSILTIIKDESMEVYYILQKA
jgi:hypothetical protein